MYFTFLLNTKPLGIFSPFLFACLTFEQFSGFTNIKELVWRDALSMWGMPRLLHSPTGTLSFCQTCTCMNISLRDTKDHLITSSQTIFTGSKTPRQSPTEQIAANLLSLFTHSFTSSILSLWALLSASIAQALILPEDNCKWISN